MNNCGERLKNGITVSYTHLDVYKRQGRHYAGRRRPT